MLKQQFCLNEFLANLGYESRNVPKVNHKLRQACDRNDIAYKKLKDDNPRKYSQSKIFKLYKGRIWQSNYTYQVDNTRMLDTFDKFRLTRKPEAKIPTTQLNKTHKEVTKGKQESMSNDKCRKVA